MTLRQFVCGLRGHSQVLHFEGSRVMLRCTTCSQDSHGWETSGRPPRVRLEGDPRRSVQSLRIVERKSA